MKHLYWESFSGTMDDTASDWLDKSMQGTVRVCLALLPMACIWLPTIYLYVKIIQVSCTTVLTYKTPLTL